MCGPNSTVTAEGRAEIEKHVDVLLAEFDKDPDAAVTFEGQEATERNMFGLLNTQSRRLRTCAPEEGERILTRLDEYMKSAEGQKRPSAP